MGYCLAPEYPRPQAEDASTGTVAHRPCGRAGHRCAPLPSWASGGAGIAAGAAILARDRGVPLAKQILIYPMLDDRTVACDDELDGLAHVWFAENNKMAWEAVLGERRGTDEVLPCEAPVRNESFEGLAPAFLEVGELDLFRDETIEYAKRLMALTFPPSPCAHGPHAHLRHVPAAHCRQGLRVRPYVISQL
ncbi:MAG: alpha/beta hydrolase fold domain-containing protein [Collinsella intestinalis]